MAAFSATATCEAWLAFLAEVFDGDAESIELLRQWFGYLFAGDTSRQKILLMFGPPRSGKGTIIKILSALLGRGSVANPTLASFSENFGMSSMIGKSVAIINDARLGRHSDVQRITERLLNISGEDTQTIDRKYREPIEVRLSARVVVVSNELPALADASGAIASRFCILETRRTFVGTEDRGLESLLLAELPGILNWAITGWRNLETAGAFAEPAHAASAREDLEALGSPMKAFLADCTESDTDAEVAMASLYRRWGDWCEQQGRREPGTQPMFGRNLRAAMPALREVRRTLPLTGRQRYYVGLRLTDQPSGYH